MGEFDQFVLGWIDSAETLTREEKICILDASLISFEHFKAICASDGTTSSRREYRRQGKSSNTDQELYNQFLKKYNELTEEAQRERKEKRKEDKKQEQAAQGANEEPVAAKEEEAEHDPHAATVSGEEPSGTTTQENSQPANGESATAEAPPQQ